MKLFLLSNSRFCIALAIGLLSLFTVANATETTVEFETGPSAERPNILLIMVDDLGFSDVGFHGSEIETPNLDALAAGGVKFSQFDNSGRCCPTRATLMTGLHPHQTGIGHMTNPPGLDNHDRGVFGYRGFLNDSCVTGAEVLKRAGYATRMTGKWHLGFDSKQCWPLQRGFDRYYGCISGATRFFFPSETRGMFLGNESIETPESTTDRAFYTTDAFTDHAIRFIAEHTESDQKSDPFYLYLAYTAPHWPLQAFEEGIAKYRGRYKIGWEKLRQQRYQRQKEIGLIDPSWPLSAPTEGIPEWDSLSEAKQAEMDLKMAVYAAMVDRVDQNIGKLVAHLKEKNLFENTLIMFLSDNGACQEGGMLGRGEFFDVEARNQQTANSYGEAWANAGSTPFRLYKHYVHEGGAATPFLMHWPAGIAARSDWYDSPAPLIDILPTMIDLAGAEYPSVWRDNPIPALEGISLRPAFDGEPLKRIAPLFMEHENNATIRDGDWKLVGQSVATNEGVDRSKWELYDMRKDRTETQNLAESMPEKLKELADQWDAWATRVGVYPKRKPADSNNAVPTAEQNPPQVAARPFSITARVRHPKPSGVVLAHGGLRFGYALHFVNGRLVSHAITVGDAITSAVTMRSPWGEALEQNSRLIPWTEYPRLTLNGKESFQFGTLDQGWWPGGLLTPPSDAAMVSDIEFLKAAGFNTIRKHIKVEPRRYYDHCDRLGVMLWQDQVSAMSDNPPWTRLAPDPVDPVWPEEAHQQFMVELKGMIDGLYNHPSIVQWVPFNERWGQHQTIEVGEWTVDGFDVARHFGYHEDIAVPQSLDWLQHRDSNKPLCLFVGTNWPHVPWPDDIAGIDPNTQIVPANHVDNETTRQRRAHYVAAVRIMDQELGQVFDLASEKLGPDTFFLHSSDHGAQWPFGKWNLYDDGIRTPRIVSWPGKIAAGSLSDAMVSWIDFLPTLVDVAAGPEPVGIDGKSFLPVLRGQSTTHRDLIFTTHSGDGDNNVYPIRAVSTPDGWKYIRNLHPEFRFTSHVTTKPGDTGYWPSWVETAKSDEDALRTVTAYQQRPAEELFHVPSDRYEQDNLIDKPDQAQRLAELRAALDQWLDQTDDPLAIFGTPTYLQGSRAAANSMGVKNIPE